MGQASFANGHPAVVTAHAKKGYNARCDVPTTNFTKMGEEGKLTGYVNKKGKERNRNELNRCFYV